MDTTPDTQKVESTVSFDVARNTVKITPKTINGVAIVNPVSSFVTCELWIELAAQMILGATQLRRQQEGLQTVKKSIVQQ